MGKLKWVSVYGKHKEFKTEKLYIGDIIVETLAEAKRRAANRFRKLEITEVIDKNRTPTTFEIYEFYK